MIPEKANSIAKISNTEITSLSQQKVSNAVVNMLEFIMIWQIPSGKNIGIATYVKKEGTPAAHRKAKVETSGFGIEEKKASLKVNLMMNALVIMLKLEPRNANSTTVTPRFVIMSFVATYKAAISI